jgi:hypothetical protein
LIGVAEAGGLHVPTKAPNVLRGILKEYLEIYIRPVSMKAEDESAYVERRPSDLVGG